MTRGRYIARRLVQMMPVLICVTIIIFVMIRLIPGDPAAAMLGDHATDAAVKRLDHVWGLDRPLYVQYFYYMKNIFELNLGTSIKFGVSVSSLLKARLTVTFLLVVCTLVLTTLISLPLGMLAALKRNSLFDNIVRSAMMVTMVMPSFWTGIILIIILSIRLKAFPVAGYGTGTTSHFYHLILPALTISLGLSPILIRTLRTSILEVMQADFVQTARAKGLRERAVITAHILRNALIPWITLLGLSVGSLMGGAVIIETVFALPGAGALLIQAVTARDYPVVQSATLVFALLVILVNLATDILYSFVDPRVQFG